MYFNIVFFSFVAPFKGEQRVLYLKGPIGSRDLFLEHIYHCIINLLELLVIISLFLGAFLASLETHGTLETH